MRNRKYGKSTGNDLQRGISALKKIAKGWPKKRRTGRKKETQETLPSSTGTPERRAKPKSDQGKQKLKNQTEDRSAPGR